MAPVRAAQPGRRNSSARGPGWGHSQQCQAPEAAPRPWPAPPRGCLPPSLPAGGWRPSAAPAAARAPAPPPAAARRQHTARHLWQWARGEASDRGRSAASHAAAARREAALKRCPPRASARVQLASVAAGRGICCKPKQLTTPASGAKSSSDVASATLCTLGGPGGVGQDARSPRLRCCASNCAATAPRTSLPRALPAPAAPPAAAPAPPCPQLDQCPRCGVAGRQRLAAAAPGLRRQLRQGAGRCHPPCKASQRRQGQQHCTPGPHAGTAIVPPPVSGRAAANICSVSRVQGAKRGTSAAL